MHNIYNTYKTFNTWYIETATTQPTAHFWLSFAGHLKELAAELVSVAGCGNSEYFMTSTFIHYSSLLLVIHDFFWHYFGPIRQIHQIANFMDFACLHNLRMFSSLLTGSLPCCFKPTWQLICGTRSSSAWNWKGRCLFKTCKLRCWSSLFRSSLFHCSNNQFHVRLSIVSSTDNVTVHTTFSRLLWQMGWPYQRLSSLIAEVMVGPDIARLTCVTSC